MAGSTCVAARKAILALVDSAAPAGTVVRYEAPPENQHGEACVYGVGFEGVDVVDPTQKAGRRRREESYDVLVACSVMMPGAESQERADTLARELLTVLDEAVADDPTLSGAELGDGQQILSARLVGWDTTDGRLGTTGFGSAFLARVRVRARLL